MKDHTKSNMLMGQSQERSSKECHGTARSRSRNGTHDDANASSSWGVHPSVARHLSEAHNGMTPREYRSLVLGQTLRAWPEEVSPQVLRTRLAAYNEELCDNKRNVWASVLVARGRSWTGSCWRSNSRQCTTMNLHCG